MTNSNAETLIQLQEAQRAYEAFADVRTALSPIAADANDYPQRINTLALQGSAGPVFANCVQEWTTSFAHLWSVLGQITAQLEAQYQQMLKVNNLNNDLAAGALPSASATPAS